MKFTSLLIRLTALAPLLVLLAVGAAIPASPELVSPASGSLTAVNIVFKLDPRLSRGLYMGDRWVSPPTFTQVGKGKKLTVEARAEGVGAGGNPVAVNPTWVSADPKTVTVSPAQANEVEINVLRPGTTKLKVEVQGVSKTLSVEVSKLAGTLQVDISQ